MTTRSRTPRTLLAGSLGLGLMMTGAACLDFGENGGSEDEALNQDVAEEQGSSQDQGPQDQDSQDQSSQHQNEAEPDGENGDEPEPEETGAAEAAASTLQLEAVAMDIPEDWSVQDAPADYTASAWSAGAFDDEEAPAEFIRILPNLDESGPAEVGASRLVATGELAEVYGENFETTARYDSEAVGAADVHAVDFRYIEEEEEILGRWWVMADSDTETMAVVEHAARADVDPDFDATAEGITFDPAWED